MNERKRELQKITGNFESLTKRIVLSFILHRFLLPNCFKNAKNCVLKILRLLCMCLGEWRFLQASLAKTELGNCLFRCNFPFSSVAALAVFPSVTFSTAALTFCLNIFCFYQNCSNRPNFNSFHSLSSETPIKHKNKHK